MRKLQQKIKRLELSMNKNREELQVKASHLKHLTHSPAFIMAGVVSGFIGGFLLVRHKNTFELIQTARTTVAWSRKLKHGAKFLSFLVF